MNGYMTHQDTLDTAFQLCLKYTGAIVECGTGEASTKMLHDLCAIHRRILISLETDKKWLSKYTHLITPWHIFVHVDDWMKTMQAIYQPISLMFIDCSPACMRSQILRYMQGKASLFVVHDTEASQGYNYGDMQDTMDFFKYRRTCSIAGCPIETTVLSDQEPL
jgi:hypothetical protein